MIRRNQDQDPDANTYLDRLTQNQNQETDQNNSLIIPGTPTPGGNSPEVGPDSRGRTAPRESQMGGFGNGMFGTESGGAAAPTQPRVPSPSDGSPILSRLASAGAGGFAGLQRRTPMFGKAGGLMGGGMGVPGAVAGEGAPSDLITTLLQVLQSGR